MSVIVAKKIGGVSGTTDHGVLSGLADDDHPQYHTDGRGDLRYIVQSGFENRNQSTISFVDGTRTFTITPIGTYYFWCSGVRFSKTVAESIVISNIEGLHFIYYDNNGVLQQSTTFLDELITLYAFVTVIYWNATNGVSILLGDERHGREMDSLVHLYHHRTEGSKWGGGLAPTNVISTGNGNLDTHAQIGVESGSFWDEDIIHTVSALAFPASIPFLYRLGASGDWRKLPGNGFVSITTGSGRAAFNGWTGATWQLTEVSQSDFLAMHLVATNNVPLQMCWIIGQAKYTTVGAARAGIDTEWNSLSTGGLTTILPEFVIVASFIVQTANGYNNAVKSRIVSTTDGAGFVDFRKATGGGAAGPAGPAGTSFVLIDELTSTPSLPSTLGQNSVSIGENAQTSVTAPNSLAIGKQSLTRHSGAIVCANGQFSSAGDAQTGKYLLRTITTNNTETELFLDGAGGTGRLSLPNNSTWIFTASVIGHRTDATNGRAGYKLDGVIYRTTAANTTTIIGSVTKTAIAESDVAWDTNITADTTNGSLKITATGETGKTIRWVAVIDTVEITN